MGFPWISIIFSWVLGSGTQVAVMDPETAGLNDLAEIVARERSSADLRGRKDGDFLYDFWSSRLTMIIIFRYL